jgi:hypothetical protein
LETEIPYINMGIILEQAARATVDATVEARVMFYFDRVREQCSWCSAESEYLAGKNARHFWERVAEKDRGRDRDS